MFKVLVTTVPFCAVDQTALQMLRKSGVECVINPLGKRLTETELAAMIADYDALIAGTEPISKFVLDSAGKLKLIARVGIGLDNVDLLEARKRNIKVTYTPDAPAPAVAELTVGLMLSLLRSIHHANTGMHDRKWVRYFGKRLSECNIGIIGCGRIGSGVIRRIQGFEPKSILVYDVDPGKIPISEEQRVYAVELERLYKDSDIISVHIPLTLDTADLITATELAMMKEGVCIINAARGGIINEHDLALALSEGQVSAAAIDVFQKEPYTGELCDVANCLLTSHMGSMSLDCRARMELEATEEVVTCSQGRKPIRPVPEEEYRLREAISRG